MYSVLVIDDFALDRKQMSDTIKSFSDLPLEIVGECEDGMEALDLIRDLKPDIILCDVEMPHITGLELAAKLRESGSKVRIIFCSLYEKLHYLQTAISVHSDGYIMKPFTRQELHDCIAKVLLELIDLNTQRQAIEALRIMMENNRETIERNFFSDIIYGYVSSFTELVTRCETLRLDPYALYRLAIVEIDTYYAEVYTHIGEAKDDDSLVCYRIFHMIEDFSRCSDGTPLYRMLRLTERCYVLMFGPEGKSAKLEAQRHFVEDTLNQLIRMAHAATISLTATFCEKPGALLKMKDQLELCRYQLEYKWLLGKGQIIYEREVPGHTPQQTINVMEVQRQVRLLLNDTQNDIAKQSIALARQLLQSLLPLQGQILCQYVFTCVQIVLQENGTEIGNVLSDSSEMYLRLLSPNTPEQYNDLIVTLLNQAHAFLSCQSKNNRSTFIEDVKQFIRESDLKSIHLGLIAEQFSYSPNYLNHIFKEETGKTILDYIILCRIEQAKELLCQPDARLSDIAEKLGYCQATYFSMVFKKVEGITPKKYMEREKNERKNCKTPEM